MATDSNYIYTSKIDENTTVDATKVRDDVDAWKTRTVRMKGQNVRDEGIDSWSLSGLRSTYVKRTADARSFAGTASGTDEAGRDVQVNANGPMGTPINKMTLQTCSTGVWLPALFYPDNSSNLPDDGVIPSVSVTIPDSPRSHIEIPYFNWGDYSGETENTQQRWVVYCSAEVFLPRPHKHTYAPGIELGLGFYWPDNGVTRAASPQIWSHSVRGLGINPTDQATSSASPDFLNKRCPTSLSYTVVTKFNPMAATGFGGSRTTIVGGVDYGWERVKIGLYYRWLRGVMPQPLGRNYIGIGNLSLFAVNYRR